ncbi:MAG: cadmium-translocating P-type ATPase [Methanocorpusculum sp.]|nr:cadmium-translocating P-type ATPase [Methanocorpusculum sp.]
MSIILNKKQKKSLCRIILASVIFIFAVLLSGLSVIPAEYSAYAGFILYLIPYLLVGGDVLLRATKNIIHGKVFDENFLMSIATIGAFALGEYPEGVAVMLFYQVGELFQSYAVNKSRRSIAELMDINPDHAYIERDGSVVTVSPDELSVDDVILIKPGDRVPVDGIVIRGSSELNTASLTGESLPRDVNPGDPVISGCINLSGVLHVRVTKIFSESTVTRILELVENASSRKAKTENFITTFSRYYTPVVVIAAAALAIIPPLLFAQPFSMWVERALTFLVVSCPCALVISIPLSFFGGIGGASASGILVKGGNYLEALAKTDTVVFDKTGTLTCGKFSVTELHPVKMSEDQLLEYAAHAEAYSSHPISISIKDAYGKPVRNEALTDVSEIAGHGVNATFNGHRLAVGNSKLMRSLGISIDDSVRPGTMIHVSLDGSYAGYLVISDTVKPDAKDAILRLKALGVKKTVMLTGDSSVAAASVAKELGIDQYHAELLPQDKVSVLEDIINQQNKNRKVAFVGDGINDAPVISRADVGIAMGSLGSDAAIEAADIVLMDDNPAKIALALQISRKTMGIVKQNIIFALDVKFLVLVLAAFGLANMWGAVFADVGVAVIAILNAMRTLNVKDK